MVVRAVRTDQGEMDLGVGDVNGDVDVVGSEKRVVDGVELSRVRFCGGRTGGLRWGRRKRRSDDCLRDVDGNA